MANKKPTDTDTQNAPAAANAEETAASTAPVANAEAEAAASEPAPAAEVTAAAPEPEAPAPAAPVSETAEVEAKAQTFMQHLQGEIINAEQSGKNDLHSWLLSLESHLGGLVTHCKRLEQEASPEIKKFVDGVKNLL
ncbi:MAG TPA: hypothetical protein VGH91_04510 [Gammaproteobacteria bacterium]|jgi:hypothetical protein